MENGPSIRVSVQKLPYDAEARTLLAWPGSLAGICPGFMGLRYAAILKTAPMTEQVREVMRPANRPPEGPLYIGECIIDLAKEEFAR